MNKQEFMVFVSCMTYNQRLYIKETLDGFCMQQTKFPFVCCIMDDASNDGEQEVIKQYLEEHFDDANSITPNETDDYFQVFVQHKANKNCFFVVFYFKYNHHQIKKSKLNYILEWRNKSKYSATCEGDDYWIDPMKLQKQVDFMETHPNHSLCFCAHRELFPSGETKDVFRYEDNKEECSMRDIILGGGGYMATNSMLYRNSMYVPYSTWVKNCPVGDLPLMLTLAHKGLVGYLADVMCVYRRAAKGSWTQKMASDIKNRRIHHYAILDMWDQFDKYSNYQYHNIIAKKKRINKNAHRKDVLRTIILKAKSILSCKRNTNQNK